MTPLLIISLLIGLALFASVFAAWREIKLSSPDRKPKTSSRPLPARRYMITGTRSGFLKLAPKGNV